MVKYPKFMPGVLLLAFFVGLVWLSGDARVQLSGLQTIDPLAPPEILPVAHCPDGCKLVSSGGGVCTLHDECVCDCPEQEEEEEAPQPEGACDAKGGDSDGDGVCDEDEGEGCAEVPGVTELNGCPVEEDESNVEEEDPTGLDAAAPPELGRGDTLEALRDLDSQLNRFEILLATSIRMLDELISGTSLVELVDSKSEAEAKVELDKIEAALEQMLTSLQGIESTLRQQRELADAAVRGWDPSRPETLTEAALTVYVQLLRDQLTGTSLNGRRLMLGPRLADCIDIIADQVIYQAPAAIMVDARENYIRSLENVRRTLHCMSTDEAVEVNQAMARALADTVAVFQDEKYGFNPKEITLVVSKVLVDELLNMVILVQDATKWLGPLPLYEWLQDNRKIIYPSLANGTNAITLAGLWLEDPVTGTLANPGPLVEDSRWEVLTTRRFTDADDLHQWTLSDSARPDVEASLSVHDGVLTLTSKSQAIADGPISWTGSTDWRDYEVSVRFRSVDGDSVGLVGRLTDADNYYRLSVDPNQSLARLERVRDGEITVLAEDLDFSGYQKDVWTNLSLNLTGNRIQAWLDDLMVFDVADPRPHNEGAVGVYVGGDHEVSFDDLAVITLVDQVVGISAASLIDALTDPFRLGEAICPAMAMILQPIDPSQGYRCREQLCECEAEQMDGPGTGPSCRQGESAYGIGLDELFEQACSESGGADSASTGSEGDRGLGSLVADVGGLVGCLNEAAFAKRQEREEQIQCLRGMMGDPLATATTIDRQEWNQCNDPLQQQATSASELGLAFAKGCVEGAGGGFQGCLAKGTLEVVGNLSEEYLGADVTAEPVEIVSQLAENLLDKVGGDFIEEVVGGLVSIVVDIVIALLTGGTDVDENETTMEAPEEDVDEEEEEEVQDEAGSENAQCAPESGNCADCSPAAAQARAFFECSPDSTLGLPEDPEGPPDVGRPDPDEPEGELKQCLDQKFEDERIKGKNTLQCAAVTCPGLTSPAVVNGRCTCRITEDGDRVPAGASCGASRSRCKEDQDPKVVNGSCMCVSS